MFVKKILFATAASAAILAASPAFAQSAPTGVAGPRVEAIVGYDSVKSFGETDDGVLYGVGAGYDVALSPGVSLGADVEASKSTIKEEIGTEEIRAGRDLYAGGRATFGISDRANVFVKAGYTNARFKYDGTLGNFADNVEGYRLGAGAQFALSGKGYVGGEVRHSRYDDDLKRNQAVLTLGTRF